MTTDARTQECPECGSRLAADPRFVAWCQECDWNLDPAPPKPETRLQALLSVRADRLARRLFDSSTAIEQELAEGALAVTGRLRDALGAPMIRSRAAVAGEGIPGEM